MADVPKTVVTSAQTIPLVLAEERVQDDRELVRLSQNGAVQPFEELVRRHQHRVLSVVLRILHRREDAEEITQQVFLKAYTSIRRFDMRSAFSTWLYKIAVNECWDSLRKKKVRPLVYESELSADQVNQLDVYARADRSTASPDERTLARDLVERLLECLSEEDREYCC